jgi:uncharacterized protein YkwD
LLLAPAVAADAKDPWPAKADRERLVAAHATFVESAREARAFLADKSRYPPPTGVFYVGKDVQIGHAEMERLVSAAVTAHNRFQRDLAKALGWKTETIGAKKATLEPLHRDSSVAEIYGVILPSGVEFDRVLAACGKRLTGARDKPAEASLARLDRILGELHLGRFEAAVAARDGADEFETLVARVVFDHALRRDVEAHDGGHDDNEMKGVRSLNAYRSALDLRPVLADLRVRAMARRFAEEQTKLGFFSHEHPRDPAQRTAADRAKLAGYGGEVLENCATGTSGFDVVWAWRNDAGHHAPLVDDRAKVVGLGCSGKSVLNLGIVCDEPIAVLLAP